MWRANAVKFSTLEVKRLRIEGLITLKEKYQQDFAHIVSADPIPRNLSLSNPKVATLYERLNAIAKRVDGLCKKHQATPADLPNPSYRAYQWFKFLSDKKWLLSHLRALEDFYALIKESSAPSRNPAPHVSISLSHFDYLYRLKNGRGHFNLEINEGFIHAPRDLKKQLIESALSKQKRRNMEAIRRYTRDSDYQSIMWALQAEEPANQRSFRGNHFNLMLLFTELNETYFQGKLEQPRLTWSARRSRRRLGAYDPQSRTITINRRFDTAETPRLLIAFILYHEMLHYALGIREVNGRRYAHTSAFKRAEMRFQGYHEAEKLVQSVNQR